MRRIGIIGFGCAGYNAAKAIRELDGSALIDIYSATGEAPYNPMLTTYFTSGKIDEEQMFPLGSLEDIVKRLNVNVLCHQPVAALRARDRAICLEDGSVKSYDDIVIASGAGAVIPPIRPLPTEDIYTMRTADDARALSARLSRGGVKRALVVGAQMVGIKVAELLWRRGIETLFVDMAAKLFPMSAYDDVAAELEQRLLQKGIELRLGSAVSAVSRRGDRLHASFSDGSETEADIVVFCSGIKPNIAFVDREELEVKTGVITDLHMRTNVPHVYAAGDCCQTRDALTGELSYIGLWANSTLQGRAAGHNIAGWDEEYQGNLIHNITHFMDMDFISMGDVRAQGERVSWAKKDGGWRLEATVSGGRIMALNILDNAGVSGPVKNALLHMAAHPGAAISGAARLALESGGVPGKVIDRLGGR